MKRQQKPSDFTLSKRQVDIIVHSTDNFRDRTLIKSLYHGGLRRDEARNLRIESVSFQNRTLVITGKFDKQRTIPFLDMEFMGDMKHLIGKKGQGYVFCNNKGDKLSLRMINCITQKAGEKADIEQPNPNYKYINPHIFRHSISRHLKNDGYPIEFIQNFLGHHHFNTTMDEYGTMGVEEMRLIADKKIGFLQDTKQIGADYRV